MALLALSLLSGCGYHSVASRDPLAGANGVNVAMFANRSYRPGLEGVLARDLVDELALRTGGRVLSASEADLELVGTIVSFASLPVSYTAKDAIKEYKVFIRVEATLREQRTQKVLWKGDLTGNQSYPVYTQLALQLNAEEAAAAQVCRNLAEEIWRKIGERF